MPRVLIVEDSELDRILIRDLLDEQEDIDDLQHDYAPDADVALRRIAEQPPDLLVTDLMLPGMHGLELLRRVKAEHPLLPVVAITARGSEETAVEALQQGAASYVPKSSLSSMLVETIDSVLATFAQRRGRSRLMQMMVESHASFVLGNDRALFRPLLQYLQDTMAEFGLFDESECMRMCVAIEEALNNAAEHGNLELDSSMREQDLRGYIETMRTRCHEQPYCDRRIHFDAHFSTRETVFEVRDEGSGFEHSERRDLSGDDKLTALSGRGLTLMRTFMDDVRFNDAGNRVTMVKRRAAGT